VEPGCQHPPPSPGDPCRGGSGCLGRGCWHQRGSGKPWLRKTSWVRKQAGRSRPPVGVRLRSAGPGPWLGPTSCRCPPSAHPPSAGPPPPRGDTRTDLPWVRRGGLRRLAGAVHSVCVQPRVQLRATRGEGQPPALPPTPGRLHPTEHPSRCPGQTHLGVPADPLGLSILLGCILHMQRGWLGWGGEEHGFGVSRGSGWGDLTRARFCVRVQLFCSLLRKRMAPRVPQGDSGFLLTSSVSAQRGHGHAGGTHPANGGHPTSPAGAQGGKTSRSPRSPQTSHLEKP